MGTIEIGPCDQARVLDLSASADHLVLFYRPSALANRVQALFSQQDYVALSCPPVDHAPIPFFLADHAQECAHANRAHDVTFYMTGCLDHCIRDNYMPMAMSTLLPSSRQRKDTSNDLASVAPLLLYAVAFHDHVETCSTAFETLHFSVVLMNVQHPSSDSFL